MSERTDPFASPATFASELASAATRRDAAAVADRWSAALLPPEPASQRPLPPAGTDGVGIWRRTVIEGETWFVRRERHALNRLWADVDRIGPKRQGKRVVLLGESCARGWPLDPLFNCSSALRALLGRVPGGNDVEIVDLARLSITPEPLRRLLDKARALDPDVYIIFAGNNWVVDLRPSDARELGAAVAANGSWRSVPPRVDALVRAQIAEWMQGLGDVVRQAGIPALFVIPAENIRDRWLPLDLCNPLLDSAGQIRRAELLTTMQRHANAGDWVEVAACAETLVALEDGCSVAGLHWLARCALARDAADEAIRLFAQARELTVHLLAFGLNSYVARSDEIRARALEQGFQVVDLSRELMTIVDDRPPGRRTFFDGCHMTAPAIVQAMAATATRLLPLLDLRSLPLEDLLHTQIAIEPRAEAQGHFIGAQLNGQDDELVGYHLARAAASTPEILDVMLHYLDLKTRQVPIALCEGMAGIESALSRFPGLQAVGTWKDTERHAGLAMLTTRTVAAVRPEALPRCRALSRRHPRTECGAIDLLAYANLGDFNRFPQHRAYLTCVRNVVSFRVMAGVLSGRCRLSMTTRTRTPGSVGKAASLLVNGAVVHTWPMTARWSSFEVVVHLDGPEDGQHVLTIAWPDPEERHEDRVRAVVQALDAWQIDDDAPAFTYVSKLYTVWGEVHTFVARRISSLERDVGTSTESALARAIS